MVYCHGYVHDASDLMSLLNINSHTDRVKYQTTPNEGGETCRTAGLPWSMDHRVACTGSDGEHLVPPTCLQALGIIRGGPLQVHGVEHSARRDRQPTFFAVAPDCGHTSRSCTTQVRVVMLQRQLSPHRRPPVWCPLGKTRSPRGLPGPVQRRPRTQPTRPSAWRSPSRDAPLA